MDQLSSRETLYSNLEFFKNQLVYCTVTHISGSDSTPSRWKDIQTATGSLCVCLIFFPFTLIRRERACGFIAARQRENVKAESKSFVFKAIFIAIRFWYGAGLPLYSLKPAGNQWINHPDQNPKRAIRESGPAT